MHAKFIVTVITTVDYFVEERVGQRERGDRGGHGDRRMVYERINSASDSGSVLFEAFNH